MLNSWLEISQADSRVRLSLRCVKLASVGAGDFRRTDEKNCILICKLCFSQPLVFTTPPTSLRSATSPYTGEAWGVRSCNPQLLHGGGFGGCKVATIYVGGWGDWKKRPRNEVAFLIFSKTTKQRTSSCLIATACTQIFILTLYPNYWQRAFLICE